MAVEGEVFLDGDGDSEEAAGAVSAGEAELVAQGGVAGELFEGIGEGVGFSVAGFDEDSAVGGDDFGGGAAMGGDDGSGAGQGFGEDIAEGFAGGGMKEDVGGLEKAVGFGVVADPMEVLLEAEFVGAGDEGIVEGAFATGEDGDGDAAVD